MPFKAPYCGAMPKSWLLGVNGSSHNQHAMPPDHAADAEAGKGGFRAGLNQRVFGRIFRNLENSKTAYFLNVLKC